MELPDVPVRRDMKNTVTFLGKLLSLARAGITLCKWSLVRQMWLFISQGLEDQGCCAVASLLVGTSVEKVKISTLGHAAAAVGHPSCLVVVSSYRRL